MQGAIAVFLITLGLGQLSSAYWKLPGVSLVGTNRWFGYGVGLGLLVSGVSILPMTPVVLLWTPPAGLLTVILLLLGGSFIAPLPHPNNLFAPEHPAHGGCRPVQIPDSDGLMPGFLLTPTYPTESGVEKEHGLAVCLVPGAGDNKISFKWRLVRALLAEGLTVLTIDPHGHGDYRCRPLVYPDCLSAIPAAIQFLREQPGIRRVGLAGISLGGAMAIKVVAEQAKLGDKLVEALVVLETSIELNYCDALFYRELWNTIYGAPVLSLLRETTIKQIWESWHSGGYQCRHRVSELFTLLNPLENISQLKDIPILLVYSRRDPIAPPSHARAMRQVVPHARLIESKKASHVTLTLTPEINCRVARWLREQLMSKKNVAGSKR